MKKTPNCLNCNDDFCKEGIDCFNISKQSQEFYTDKEINKLFIASSEIEAKYYCQEPRVREIKLFAEAIQASKLGIVYCVGLEKEALFFSKYLSKDFELYSVRCKCGGILKSTFNLPQIQPEKKEAMCNPAGQAILLNKVPTDLNIVVGLCVGHDSIFYKLSQAPVTTFITKDRVLGHNPVAAVYNQYLHKKFNLT